jgi:hypothetical protein
VSESSELGSGVATGIEGVEGLDEGPPPVPPVPPGTDPEEPDEPEEVVKGSEADGVPPTIPRGKKPGEAGSSSGIAPLPGILSLAVADILDGEDNPSGNKSANV